MPALAVTATMTFSRTGDDLRLNDALINPAGICTLTGTLTTLLPLEIATSAPEPGAGPASVIVPVAPAPPVTAVALSDNNAIPTGDTVKGTESSVRPSDATSTTLDWTLTFTARTSTTADD